MRWDRRAHCRIITSPFLTLQKLLPRKRWQIVAVLFRLALRLYDTLSGRKKKFEPIARKKVKMFVCGPTVYDSTHLGHGRTFIVYDVLARYLHSKGFKVFFVMNLTDLDDKIFQRAKQEGVSYQQISQRYEEEFREVLKALNIDMVSMLARASDYLDKAISQISKILSNRFAYIVGGNVYFDTSKSPEYGKLSHLSPLELKMRRIQPSPEKRNQTDFLLWNGYDGYPSWDSRFGSGRPGWHIEDTAIAITHLGSQYDIHGGGAELKFPHHDAEIAQAEVITGKKHYVNYWIHSGLLKVRGRKMSKSLGNYILLKDLLKKYNAATIRILCLSTHYRKDADFSERVLAKAKIQAEQISEAGATLCKDRGGQENFARRIMALKKQFYRAMDDDLNTPKALAFLFSLAKLIIEKSKAFDARSCSEAKTALSEMLQILGIAA